MDYIIIRRNADKANAKWEMAMNGGQMFRSHGDALAKSRRLAREVPHYEFMTCEMQTSVICNDIRTIDHRAPAPKPNNKHEWF